MRSKQNKLLTEIDFNEFHIKTGHYTLPQWHFMLSVIKCYFIPRLSLLLLDNSYDAFGTVEEALVLAPFLTDYGKTSFGVLLLIFKKVLAVI